MTKDEALTLALKALQEVYWSSRSSKHDEAITAIKQALLTATPLAAPVQEPVAAQCKFDREQKWLWCEIAHHNLVQSEPHAWPGYQTRLLYTTPPAQEFVCSTGLCHYKVAAQRQWVGLTDEEMKIQVEAELVNYWNGEYADTTGAKDCLTDFARTIEAKLKEKNT